MVASTGFEGGPDRIFQQDAEAFLTFGNAIGIHPDRDRLARFSWREVERSLHDRGIVLIGIQEGPIAVVAES